MKVSIIIPVYNVANYINRCLQSVAEQTYQDIECLLVDDCGNDNSADLVDQFINTYEGNIEFIFLHHNSNRGQSAARNTAIQMAKGEYLYFLDSDDAITPDCIESLISLAIKHPDADYVQGNILDEEGKIGKYGWHTQLSEYVDEHAQLEEYILSKVVTSAWNKVIKASFIRDNELYFPEGIIHEDLYWSFFLAKHAKAAAFLNKGTYIYFINENSIITSPSPHVRIRRYSSRLYSSETFCSDLDKEGCASRNQRLFIAGNLTSAMIEVAGLHSLRHWHIFWKHIWNIYRSHKHLSFWQHVLFLFLMPPLCFPIRIKGWYWRVQRYIVSKI